MCDSFMGCKASGEEEDILLAEFTRKNSAWNASSGGDSFLQRLIFRCVSEGAGDEIAELFARNSNEAEFIDKTQEESRRAIRREAEGLSRHKREQDGEQSAEE